PERGHSRSVGAARLIAQQESAVDGVATFFVEDPQHVDAHAHTEVALRKAVVEVRPIRAERDRGKNLCDARGTEMGGDAGSEPAVVLVHHAARSSPVRVALLADVADVTEG